MVARLFSLQAMNGDSTSQSLRTSIEKLKVELKELEDEATKLEQTSIEKGVREEEIQRHIELLHQYNDLKDAGQTLFGKLAELEGTLVKNMYERFGLNIDD